MLLSCHALELTPMRCHSFCEVFVALLSGRSCKCASAAPKFAVGKWWTGTLVPQYVAIFCQSMCRIWREPSNWSAQKMMHEVSDLFTWHDLQIWKADWSKGTVRFVGCHTSTFLVFSVKPELLMSGCYVQPGNASNYDTQVVLITRRCRNWRMKQSSLAFSEAISNHLGRNACVLLVWQRLRFLHFDLMRLWDGHAN